ncbi:MAG: Glu/Leu/Phe/Val dehydrogenase dimerization domain-containing protein [Candidatus Competibacterales bacterium]|nr:Glu/Leu/Phe/Val dehydrogenase dimerization domain-containing protein [Candidatus Competibacterales bacterium]
MSVFTHEAFDAHEQVVFCHDAASGLRAIIAIHDTTLGPALGGCRMWPYPSENAALTDVLRLARGMSYKSALAGLELGGGKSVIIGDPRRDKHPDLLRAFAHQVDALGGRYIAAEDSGTSVEDLRLMHEFTPHVAGIADKPAADGRRRSGDPSPATAYGVFAGLRAAVAHRLGRRELAGLRVAVQGVGHVGLRLARLLREAGADLWLSDVDPERLQAAADELGATAVAPEAVFDLDVDVFAPCALGAVIDDRTLPRLRARVIAGAANNQLAEPRHGRLLQERGILYAPDYVINAGGIIDVALERRGFDRAQLLARLDGIHDVLLEIFHRAETEHRPTAEIADWIAEERLRRH